MHNRHLARFFNILSLNDKHMKKMLALLFLVLLMFLLDGCEVIGGIFKAGVWVGVLLVLVVIGVIVWLVTRGAGKS
jgi:hypothetical protein